MSFLSVGDSVAVLKKMDSNSIDAVVTDPPYGLAFMGKKWDYDVPSVELWCEVLRVLKPGGHLLSFGGTRTYHRMVVNVEDAGFEIRDQLQWIYGSGFPKSLDISKAIDKAAGAEREIVGQKDVGPDMRGGNFENAEGRMIADITAPATDLAKQWQGWGTALKPANEPIVLARKPLVGTVAENVEEWGTGALNVDASRIGYGSSEKIDFTKVQDGNIYGGNGVYGKAEQKHTTPLFKENGRWPANVLFDEDAASVLDKQSEAVSRFFYVAKASRRERGEGNNHPTVKPVKLMEYLVRLVTPPGGTVLDPFMGSGTTGIAAKKLGFSFVGIEREPAYMEIAKRRIEATA